MLIRVLQPYILYLLRNALEWEPRLWYLPNLGHHTNKLGLLRPADALIAGIAGHPMVN